MQDSKPKQAGMKARATLLVLARLSSLLVCSKQACHKMTSAKHISLKTCIQSETHTDLIPCHKPGKTYSQGQRESHCPTRHLACNRSDQQQVYRQKAALGNACASNLGDLTTVSQEVLRQRSVKQRVSTAGPALIHSCSATGCL